MKIIIVKKCLDCPWCMVKANKQGCGNPGIKNRWVMIETFGDIRDDCPLEDGGFLRGDSELSCSRLEP